MLSEHQQHTSPALHKRLQRFFLNDDATLSAPPRWQHPLIGYVASLLLVGLSLGGGLLERLFPFPFSLPGILLLLAVVTVASIWGATPSLFAIVLSLLVLDYLYVPPFGILNNYSWDGLFQLLIFTVVSIAVMLLARQRESARSNTALKVAHAQRQGQEVTSREQELSLKEARANLAALRKEYQQMEEALGIICHELKTPLTIMKGNLQLAERKIHHLTAADVLSPEAKKRFEPIQTLIERARGQIGLQDRLVNDLLDFSRVQKQTLSLSKASCNLVTIVQEAVKNQQQLAPNRTIMLALPLPQEVLVYGDADRLFQVLTNYLTNALKYSAEQQPVIVNLSVKRQVVRVSVYDKGPGLPLEARAHIWERFYRVPGTMVQSGTGVGLGVGLYLCRTLIEQHDGQVGVESLPGEGSTFWFTLPLQPANGWKKA